MKFLFSILLCVSTICLVGQSNDTNYVDKDNLKQGYWRILGKDKKLPNYKPNQLIQEGNYVDSRKKGLWKRYYPNGKVKSKITYVNSRSNGAYETYYKNGLLEEKGTWKNNRNGYFERWDYKADGCLDVWKYYQKDSIYEVKKYDTCDCLLYEVILDTLTGLTVKNEYENCKFIKTSPYTNKYPEEIYKNWNRNIIYVAPEYKINGKGKVKETGEWIKTKSPKKGAINFGFNGKGPHKIYNKNRQIIGDGIFKRYRLIDGKHYIYDEEGILIQIKKFKEGRYIGDEPLPVKE